MKRLLVMSILIVCLVGNAHAQIDYGVIFSGGSNAGANYDRYYDETLRMWNIMTGPLGYEQVYVLFADGLDPGVDRSSGVSSDWSMITAAGGNIEAATYANLENRLLSLQTQITHDDTFHFWSFDHGYGSSAAPDTGGLVSWGTPWIDDDVFASWVNPIDSYAQSFAFGQCYAGDMVDDLNILPGENRFAAWAADWYEPSYGRGWADAWADGLEAGLFWTHDLGEYALWNDPFGPFGLGLEHPGWTGDNFNIITGEPVPVPGAALLGMIGLAISGLRLRKRA